MHPRSKSSIQKICVSLEKGKHCIDATRLTPAQMEKYAASAEGAIVDRRLGDNSPGMVARALHQVFEPQNTKTTGEFKLIDATAFKAKDLPLTTNRPSVHVTPSETYFNAQWYSQYEMPAGALDTSSN